MALPAPNKYLQNPSAGWRYSNGGDHFAYDFPMPIGTPLYATANGYILDTNDGIRNNYKQRPSNWILLRVKHKGRYATIYYQHLNKGLLVKPGDTVEAGQKIGYSGNSGWSTGPHLHLATGWGQWTAGGRYNYMANDGRNNIVIFPPSNLYKHPWGIGTHVYGWKGGPSVSRFGSWRVHDGKANGRDNWWVRQIQAMLGVQQTGYFGSITHSAVKNWQKKRGLSPTGLLTKAQAKRMGLPV